VPYRVVANPPFGLTTEILSMLLDDPDRGPDRADLILQREVAVKHSQTPATSLRTAAWAPWWEFDLGPVIDRDAFRPRPSVDAAVLRIHRRRPALFPGWLAPRLRDALRPVWVGRAPAS
jgi:23S rRNA (adenine-N6)-dimethyltransferase